MADIAITVQGLGKRFHVSATREKYYTFRDILAHRLKSIFRDGRRDTSKKDETIWALKNLSFEVRHGEVVGIIGRNGAGKSTLLKILSRITEPTTGFAEISGRVGSLLEVGTGFHPELTGRENIFLNGAILGMKKAEISRKFDEIVDFAEVSRFIDTPVKHYSSGMYLRLAFAVAAHLEPDILIVDEVLAVGDARFQKKCLDKMQDVGAHGRTVLFVSHNMQAITRLCPRAILLDNGSILEDGPSHKVVRNYLNSGFGTTAKSFVYVLYGCERKMGQRRTSWISAVLSGLKWSIRFSSLGVSSCLTSMFTMRKECTFSLRSTLARNGDNSPGLQACGSVWSIYLEICWLKVRTS
jgi:lipopolysaccharide transport system ATP-binding protein